MNTRRRYLWLPGLLLLTLLFQGCGSSNSGGASDGTSTVFGPGAPNPNPTVATRSLTVQIAGNTNRSLDRLDKFANNVVSFLVEVRTADTLTVIASQTVARSTTQNTVQATFGNLPGTTVTVDILALDAQGNTVSYYVQAALAPDVVTVTDNQFTAGPLPAAPFPVPTPSPTPIPSPSPILPQPSPSPSPGSSPSASPSPGSSPSASPSPGSSPSASPSPGSSPSASPSPGSSPSASPSPGGVNGKLYVSSTSNLLRFGGAFTANGQATPEVVFTSGSLNSPGCLRMDTANNRLYIANLANVCVFNSPQSKVASSSPDRIFTVNGAQGVVSMTLDTSKDTMYVLDSGGGIFRISNASTANGTVSAVTTFQSTVANSSLFSLCVDQVNNRLFVGGISSNNLTNGFIGVYDNASTLGSGNVSLTRTINGVQQPFDMMFDKASRLAEGDARFNTSQSRRLLAILNPGTTNGAANFGLQANISPIPLALGYDTNNDALYVGENNNSTAQVEVYSNFSTTTGSSASPARTITATSMTSANGVAIDPNN